MTAYNFTQRVREILAMAAEEAKRRRHQYVGTEHLLLALLRGKDGGAAVILRKLGVNAADIVAQVDGVVTHGKVDIADASHLPYTTRSKRVLELAIDSARDLSQSHVDTEHLLLGLLGEKKGIGAQVLVHAGVTEETARSEVFRLGSELQSQESLEASATDSSRIAGVLRGNPDDEIVAMESRLRDAQLTADVAALDRLIDDNLLFTGPDGQLGTKAQDLEAHRSGVVRFRAHDPRELRVRRVGDNVAITALLADLEVEVAGNLTRGSYRYTRVWARAQDGRWRVVGGHVSAVPDARS